MKIMRTIKYKREYKYDQLMKIIRTMKYKSSYITFYFNSFIS